MADVIEYKLKGADDIVARFRQLSRDIRRKVAVPAAKDAMQIVLDDAVERAYRIDRAKTKPVIAQNITMVERKAMGEELDAAIVSVGVKRRGKGGGTFYWKFVELGTEHARARPFLRPALSQNQKAVFSEFLSSARYQLIKLGEY